MALREPRELRHARIVPSSFTPGDHAGRIETGDAREIHRFGLTGSVSTPPVRERSGNMRRAARDGRLRRRIDRGQDRCRTVGSGDAGRRALRSIVTQLVSNREVFWDTISGIFELADALGRHDSRSGRGRTAP